MKRSLLRASAAAACLFACARAHAGDPQKADALFRQGRAALEHGQYARACDLLQKSLDEDATATGTLLNLAYCHQVTGRPWQAWVEYGQAAREANAPDRRDFALKSMRDVAQKLPHVALQWEDVVPGRVVRDDGSVVDDPTRPFPVAPGKRTLTIDYASGATRALTFDVPDRPGVVAVIVATGAATTSPPAPAPPSVAPIAPIALAPEPPPSKAAESTRADDARATWAIALGGVAVAGVGVGTAFGLRSFAIRDSACPTKECDAAGLERIHGGATTTAVVSTVAFGVALAAAAGAVAVLVKER